MEDDFPWYTRCSSKENQVRALHVYVDKMDANMVKTTPPTSIHCNVGNDHCFLLHIRMHLVPKIDTVLNTEQKES